MESLMDPKEQKQAPPEVIVTPEVDQTMTPESTGQSDAQDSDIPVTLATGTVVSERYEILAFVGRGGMGEVYKVLDQQTRAIYALKMIAPHLAQQKLLAKRLEHEAQAARTLVHGNIATVYDIGTTPGGQPYMLLDYIDGDSLETLLKKETVLPVGRALELFLQIADALVHARLKGIVHRDLKPSNIIVTKSAAGTDLIKIVDFGIAKITDQDRADKAKLTQTGELLGTPLYMSPEQCRGDEIDERSDIYSFGCIMHETLSGASPFSGANPVRVILKHLDEDPPPLPNNVGITSDLKQIIMRCLQKSPQDRYQNASELQNDLERVHDGRPIVPHKIKKHTKPGATPGKNKAIFVGLASIIVLGGMVGLFAMPRPTPVVDTDIAPISQRPETFMGKTLTQWTSYIERHPDDAQGYFNRGSLHSMRDERTNAVDDYSDALKIKPDYIEALRRRAMEYVMLAKADLAAKDANLIIKMAPDSASSFETRASVNQVNEQYTDAIADWQKAIKLDTNNGFYYYMLGTCYLKMGDYNATIDAIKHAQEAEGEAPSAAQSVASLAYVFRHEMSQAKEAAEAAVAKSEARGVEWSVLAYYYGASGDMQNAQINLNKARSIETFPARAMRLAGEVYRTAGQYEQAIKEFSSETSLEEYPPGYRQRAMTYIQLDQWRAALSDLKKSASLNPLSATTLSYLAYVEDHLGMTSAADEHLKKAIKSKSRPAIVYSNSAAIKLARKNLSSALSEANKAIAIDPYLKEAYLVRSKIHSASGDSAAASADKTKADSLYPQMDF